MVSRPADGDKTTRSDDDPTRSEMDLAPPRTHRRCGLDDDDLAALMSANEVLERLIGLLRRGDGRA